jgi:hypothetical protein
MSSKPFAPCDTNLSSYEEYSPIGLRSDGTLKNECPEKPLSDFWLNFVRNFQLWQRKDVFCYDLLLRGRVFRTIGSEIEKEEQDGSRR